MKDEKAQFFLITIVIISLFIIVIMTHIVSIDESSVTLFEHSTYSDYKNVQNAIHERNLWLTNASWWNVSWHARKMINITGGISNPVQVDANLPAGKIASCLKEIRVIDSSGAEVTTDVDQDAPPCDVVFAASTGHYYIYYNNSGATQPAGRTTGTGTPPTFTVFSEEDASGNLCNHLKYVYGRSNYDLNCTRTVSDATETKYNYSVEIHSDDLEFIGIID